MEVVMRLSTEEASLIQQLIGLAEDNDFFESEFDDEHERGSYKKLHELACRLRQKLASVDESDGKEAADGEPANLGERIMSENGRPWWEVSGVRLGLRPSQLHARVKEFSGELAGLIFYSDSLEARQSMLEAVYVLRSAERSLKARANSDVGKEATKG